MKSPSDLTSTTLLNTSPINLPLFRHISWQWANLMVTSKHCCQISAVIIYKLHHSWVLERLHFSHIALSCSKKGQLETKTKIKNTIKSSLNIHVEVSKDVAECRTVDQAEGCKSVKNNPQCMWGMNKYKVSNISTLRFP